MELKPCSKCKWETGTDVFRWWTQDPNPKEQLTMFEELGMEDDYG